MLPSLVAAALLAADPQPLGPGDPRCTLELGGRERSYLVHVPPKYDPKQPTPVVLAFHGGMTNAAIMALASGLNEKADKAGFIVVYPNGTGKGNLLLVWNSGGFEKSFAEKLPDDVAFVGAILDDLARRVNVDPKRVYATGISNGGMMCYRLAAEGRWAGNRRSCSPLRPGGSTSAERICTPGYPATPATSSTDPEEPWKPVHPRDTHY